MRNVGRVCALLLCGWSAAAEMPAREAFRRAEPEVRAATAGLLADLARGETTREEVAEAVRIMASQTAEPAEEYLFLQGAFRLFVRAGAYGRAADVLRRLRKREFPAMALADLAGHALEPVPRGTDVGELESMWTALRDEAAQVRRLAEERRTDAALARTRLPAFAVEPGETLPDVLARLRGELSRRGEPGFHALLRCRLAPDGRAAFPALPATRMTDESLADILARCAALGGYETRTRGALRFFTCPAPNHAPSSASAPWADDAGETARRLKRVRIGFVAFGGDETVDVAVERLLTTVRDFGGRTDPVACDVVLWAPPDGRFPPVSTVRASDTTLYDALDLAAASAGYVLDVRGACLVLRPGAAGTVP